MPCWSACCFDILHCSHFFITVLPHGGWESIIHLQAADLSRVSGIWCYWMEKLMQLWVMPLENEVLRLSMYCKNNIKWCVLVVMALNKEGFGRKESKTRHDYMHCWMSFRKMGNAKIIISSWLAFYTKMLLRISFPNSCTIKRSCCPQGHVQLLWHFFALVLWDISSTARVQTELSHSPLWVKKFWATWNSFR